MRIINYVKKLLMSFLKKKRDDFTDMAIGVPVPSLFFNGNISVNSSKVSVFSGEIFIVHLQEHSKVFR